MTDPGLSGLAFDALLEHIAVLDAAGVIVQVNASWRRFSDENGGQEMTTGLGVSYLDVCRRAAHHDESAAEALSGIEALLAGTRQQFQLEYPCHSPDRRRWFRLHAAALPAGRGGLVASHLDVTVRRLAEERMMQAQERFRDLLDFAPDAMLVGDESGIINVVNRRAEEMFGRPRSALVGSTIEALVPESVRSRHAEHRRAFGDNPSTRTMGVARQLRACRADGSEFPVEISLAPLRTGERLEVLAAVRDISDRRALESQLARARQLESIGQLAAGVAHEINTPMQFISDSVHFLEEAFGGVVETLGDHRRLIDAARAGPVAAEVLLEIEQAFEARDMGYVVESAPGAIASTIDGVRRVVDIVRAMKQFSHPGGGGADGKTLTDLNAALRATLTVSRNEWKYVAEIVTDLAPDLPFVPCNPGEMNQVFLNLIVNAAHAMGDVAARGGAGAEKGTLTLSTRRDGDFVEIRVADTGTGIPESVRDRVFDLFFTTKEVGRGTGQGLALAHAVVVKDHGGTLSFETDVGRGTTFLVRLPLVVPRTSES